ncbi:DUF5677 domain-containing protein [Cupriavidus metallidurans]
MVNEDTIDNILDNCISDVTRKERILPVLLRKAAIRNRLVIEEAEIQLISDAILRSSGDRIVLDIDPPCSLGQTEKEIENTIQSLLNELKKGAEADISTLTDAIARAIPQALEVTAAIVGNRLAEKTAEHGIELQRIGFERVEAVKILWGQVFDDLDLLRQLMVEWCHTAEHASKGPYVKPHVAIALHKLTDRAFDVIGEVIALSRAGYADGALARWRTLHEICVISVFLARHSDRCAQMYLDHHVVEKLKLVAGQYALGTALTRDLHRDRYIRSLRSGLSTLVKRYGEAFAGDYGWASIELGTKKTTFRTLEQHVDLEILRNAYQKANSVVHGGALAALTRISLGVAVVEANDAPLAHGCEIAVNYAAASISMLIAELCLDTESADLLAFNMIIQNRSSSIRDQIEATWERISRNSPRARILERKAAIRQRSKREVLNLRCVRRRP